MSLEELHGYEAVVNERLHASAFASNEELRAAIAALRALDIEPDQPLRSISLVGRIRQVVEPISRKLRLGQSGQRSPSKLAEEKISQMVEGVRDLLSKPHVYAPDQTDRFKTFVHNQIAKKISDLEARAEAEDYGVIQLVNSIFLRGKYKPHFENASDCRQWLQENADLLDQVEGIDLSDKNLTVIPREIALFRNMQTLFLYGNHLQSLEGVALPESLKRLDLRGNQIQNLEGVVLPKFLRELYLSGNQIQSLQGLAPLKSLRRLNLTNNRISELPNWIFQLPTNCEVNVAGNRLPTHLSTQISEIINRRREKGLDSPKIMF